MKLIEKFLSRIWPLSWLSENRIIIMPLRIQAAIKKNVNIFILSVDIPAHCRCVCVTQMSPSPTSDTSLFLLLFSHTQAISDLSFLWSYVLVRKIQENLSVPGHGEREMLPDSAAVHCGLGIPTNGSPTKRYSPQTQPESKSPSHFMSHTFIPQGLTYCRILQNILLGIMHAYIWKQAIIWNKKIPGLFLMDLGRYSSLKTFAVCIVGTVVRDEGLSLRNNTWLIKD